MADPRTDVLVIGVGVSGLTTTIGLLEAGLPASSLRLAIWGPYLSYLSSSDQDTDGWGRLPPGFVSGWRYTVPVVDMPMYLAYLLKRLEHAGLVVEPGRFDSLADAATEASVIVNCAGLGARRLARDDAVRPVRGQLVVVENPGLEQFFAEHTDDVCDLTYLLPQGDHIVLGGSVEDGEAECVVDPNIAEGIIERCVAIEPALRGVRVLGHRVGLRPTRPYVRVERDDSWSVPVVHNYGHGGSGVSLSWGCAREVVRLVLTT